MIEAALALAESPFIWFIVGVLAIAVTVDCWYRGKE